VVGCRKKELFQQVDQEEANQLFTARSRGRAGPYFSSVMNKLLSGWNGIEYLL
jgi:hypothetical protein